MPAGVFGAQNRVRAASILAKSDREESTSGVVSQLQGSAEIGLHPRQSPGQVRGKPHGAPGQAGQVRDGFSCIALKRTLFEFSKTTLQLCPCLELEAVFGHSGCRQAIMTHNWQRVNEVIPLEELSPIIFPKKPLPKTTENKAGHRPVFTVKSCFSKMHDH